MAEEAKNSTTNLEEQPTEEPIAQMCVDTSEPMANHKVTPALLHMTEEWKKSKLDEIKKQMKAQTSKTIVRESWGGDRETASVSKTVTSAGATVTEVVEPATVTEAVVEAPTLTAGEESRPKRRGKFGDSGTVTVSSATAQSTGNGGT